MLRLGLVSFLVFLASSNRAFSQDSISISDFRYPETRAIDLKGGLSGDFYNQTSDDNRQDSIGAILSNGNGSSGNINANCTFLMFNVDEAHTLNLQAASSFQYNGSSDNFGYTNHGANDSEDTRRDDKSVNVSISAAYLRYFNGDGIHVFGIYDLVYKNDYQKSAQSRFYGSYLDYSSSDSYRQVTFDDEGVIGVGYGRIRDGTFVFQALRIVERLREDGVLKVPLSHAQTISLIDRVAHIREYTTNYERWEKYLVHDIVQELSNSGVIDSNLVSAYSSVRVAEGLRELIEPRFFGWRISYGFGVHGNTDRSTRYEGSSEVIWNGSTGDNFLHRFDAECGYPLSLYTHFHSALTVKVPRWRSDLFSTIQFVSTLSHQVGERVDVQINYSFTKKLNTVSELTYEKQFTHTISGSFIYFIEDRVRFTTTVIYKDYFDRGFEEAESALYSGRWPTFSISFGLLYNII